MDPVRGDRLLRYLAGIHQGFWAVGSLRQGTQRCRCQAKLQQGGQLNLAYSKPAEKQPSMRFRRSATGAYGCMREAHIQLQLSRPSKNVMIREPCCGQAPIGPSHGTSSQTLPSSVFKARIDAFYLLTFSS